MAGVILGSGRTVMMSSGRIWGGPYVLPRALKPLRKAFPAMRLMLHEGRTPGRG
jgi:hypothetical protein